MLKRSIHIVTGPRKLSLKLCNITTPQRDIKLSFGLNDSPLDKITLTLMIYLVSHSYNAVTKPAFNRQGGATKLNGWAATPKYNDTQEKERIWWL